MAGLPVRGLQKLLVRNCMGSCCSFTCCPVAGADSNLNEVPDLPGSRYRR